MCIIAYKPEGVEFPKDEYLSNSWNSNNDGAGFMYLDGDKVVIQKGYMKFDEFMEAVNKKKTDGPMVLHFRTATHGGVRPELTHPFPVSSSNEDLMSLYIESKMGIVHNGVFRIPIEKGLSDSQQFIKDFIAPDIVKKNLANPTIRRLIAEAIGSSKLLILKAGEIFKFGSYWKEHEGCFYSNSDYETKTWKTTYYYGHGYSKYHFSKDYTKKDEDKKDEDKLCPCCNEKLTTTKSLGDEYYHCEECGEFFEAKDLEEMIKELLEKEEEATCPICKDKVKALYKNNNSREILYFCKTCEDYWEEDTLELCEEVEEIDECYVCGADKNWLTMLGGGELYCTKCGSIVG